MFLAFPIIVGLIVWAIIVGRRKARERQAALVQWAGARGLHLSPTRDREFRDRFPQFDCFKQGEQNRYAFNIASGAWNGRTLVAFHYHYETTSRDKDGHTRTTSWYFSGVLLKPRIPLKPLQIRAENFFDKIAGVFGFDDIDFESAEFSRRFCVKSPDRKWAYDVLHAQTIEFLLQSPRFTVEFDREWVLAYKSGQASPGEHEQAIAVLEGILDRLPNYVIEQQKVMTI